MLPSAGIKASADWSQNVEAQSPCNPACSLSTLRSLMLYSNAVTDCHARLATGGWLTLARLASHQLDYSPFVWAHNPDLSLCFVILPLHYIIYQKKAPTAIMATSANSCTHHTTLNIFLSSFSLLSPLPENFCCSLRADSTSSILAISAAASSESRVRPPYRDVKEQQFCNRVYYYRYSGSIPLFQMGYYPSC